MKVYMVSTLYLLGTTWANTLPSFPPSRSCNLVRSSFNSGSQCFSEPECSQQCSTAASQQCFTQMQSQCSNVAEQQCSTVNEQQCSIVSDQQCNTVYDTKYVEQSHPNSPHKISQV